MSDAIDGGDSNSGAAVSPSQVAPGWYPDGTGLRWWDGQSWSTHTWGGAVPTEHDRVGQTAAAGLSDEKLLAILAEISPLVGGPIIPLIIYLAVDRRKLFVRSHAATALNVALISFVISIVVVAMMFVVIGLAGLSGGEGVGAVVGFFTVFALIAALSFGPLIIGIVGAIRAGNLETFVVPRAIRLVNRDDPLLAPGT